MSSNQLGLVSKFYITWSFHENILNPNLKSSLSGKSQECDPLHTSYYNCLQVEIISSLALLQVNLTAVDIANKHCVSLWFTALRGKTGWNNIYEDYFWNMKKKKTFQNCRINCTPHQRAGYCWGTHSCILSGRFSLPGLASNNMCALLRNDPNIEFLYILYQIQKC